MANLMWFLIAFCAAAFCQGRPAFDVATVKATRPTPGAAIGLFTFPGGRINATQLTLRNLIAQAYGIQDYQLSGGPGWANNDRWDVVGQPAPGSEAGKFNPPTIKTAPTPEMLEMLQTLLAERFQLKLRKETKEGSGLALMVADKGPKLTPAKDINAFKVVCYGRTGKADRPDFLCAENASMDLLASRLALDFRRPVLNRTGIEGTFDFRFEYAGDLLEGAPGPSLATALQEALGLKVVGIKAPVDTWVIEGAERPTEN
ncbi:MAG: TIGR03435 family protein [Bryobacteraceae bacterium]